MIIRKEIIEFFNRELSLPFIGTEQDWEVEMADSKRIIDFLNYYINNGLSNEKKKALMALILASYDDFLSENELDYANVLWDKIQFLLKIDKELLIELITYWSLDGEQNRDNMFRITPLMRKLKRV